MATSSQVRHGLIVEFPASSLDFRTRSSDRRCDEVLVFVTRCFFLTRN